MASNVFRSRKTHWKKENCKPYETNEERLENGPDDLSYEEWAVFVEHWGKPHVQEIADLNELNRSKQVIKHTSGRKSFPRCTAEMTTEETGPPSLGDLFIETHISKATNNALDHVSREYIAQMQHEAGFDENGKKKSIPNEIDWKLMPPERNGLVRMMGPLPTKTKLFGSRSSNGENATCIQGLEAQLSNMTTEMSNLKRKLEEKDQDAERRLTEREDAIERLMLLKLKAMMGILSPNNDLDGMELDLNLDLNVASAAEEWSGCT